MQEAQSPVKEKVEEKPESPTKVDPEHQHKEESSSDDEHDHHGHDHGHDHDHAGHDHAGHDHDHDDKKGGADGKKSSRGEKKFKKAMTKLGMKPVPGINRVTIKKAKSLLLYIDDPEILKNPGSDNSYIIFGEAKILDFPGNLANEEASKFKKPEKPEDLEKLEKEKATEQPQPEVKEEEGEVNEEGLQPDVIKMVMEHCSCSRAKAVNALRKSDGDSVNAILELTGTG